MPQDPISASIAALSIVWQLIQRAGLSGLPLMLALLMAFFAGVFFTIRRLRLDARAFWRLVLKPADSAEPTSETQQE